MIRLLLITGLFAAPTVLAQITPRLSQQQIDQTLILWKSEGAKLEVTPDQVMVWSGYVSDDETTSGGQWIPEAQTRAGNWRNQGGQSENGVRCVGRKISFVVQDPFDGSDRRLVYEQYKDQNKGRRNMRSLIMIPPTGGINAGDRTFARQLCRYGYHVMILKSDLSEELGTRVAGGFTFTEQELAPDFLDRSSLRSYADLEYTLAYIQPVHQRQVGVIGTSVGAIMTSFNIAVNSRLNVATIMMGGVGLGEIVAKSDLESLRALAAKRKETFAMCALPDTTLCSDLDYEAWLKENIFIEPGNFAQMSSGKDLLITINEDDTTVPAANQKALAEAFNHPGNTQQIITYNGQSHVASITSAYLDRNISGAIHRFFQKNLREGDNPPPPPTLDANGG